MGFFNKLPIVKILFLSPSGWIVWSRYYLGGGRGTIIPGGGGQDTALYQAITSLLISFWMCKIARDTKVQTGGGR